VLATLYAIVSFITGMLGYAFIGMASTLTTFTDRVRISEFLKWEIEQRYTRDAKTIKNLNAAALGAGGIVVGTPLTLTAGQYGVMQTGSESSLAGFFLGNDPDRIPEALAANAITVGKYQILVRGPALIDKDLIPTVDGDGGSLNVTSIMTAANALGIYALNEPTASATSTQTT
jgi:hypothetical protein